MGEQGELTRGDLYRLSEKDVIEKMESLRFCRKRQGCTRRGDHDAHPYDFYRGTAVKRSSNKTDWTFCLAEAVS